MRVSSPCPEGVLLFERFSPHFSTAVHNWINEMLTRPTIQAHNGFAKHALIKLPLLEKYENRATTKSESAM
jgi:hypothetical protein